jgi:hypothetical protein
MTATDPTTTEEAVHQALLFTQGKVRALGAVEFIRALAGDGYVIARADEATALRAEVARLALNRINGICRGWFEDIDAEMQHDPWNRLATIGLICDAALQAPTTPAEDER